MRIITGHSVIIIIIADDKYTTGYNITFTNTYTVFIQSSAHLQ